MQRTVPVRISKRKAREERLQEFQALADFANLGDTPEDWKQFRLKWPNFFPEDLTKRFYKDAVDWAEQVVKDGWSLDRATLEDSAELRDSIRWLNPPLLYYRDLLRAVWKKRDPDGMCLKFLLGFEQDAIKTELVQPPTGEGDLENPPDPTPEEVAEAKAEEWERPRFDLVYSDPPPEEPCQALHPIKVGGMTLEPTIPKKPPTVAGLPGGTPVVDGIAGTISWDFGCQIQRAIYDLMHDRWRAMVCPQCGTYFIADKTAQKYCSRKCYREKKEKQSLDYYYREGRFLREKTKTSRTKSHRSKS